MTLLGQVTQSRQNAKAFHFLSIPRRNLGREGSISSSPHASQLLLSLSAISFRCSLSLISRGIAATERK